MKLDSKLFDRIRIRPRHFETPRAQTPPCAWEGCDQAGLYRAPKGHRAEGEYHLFCLEHVRHYNTAFNFFSGMDADAIEAHVHRTAATDGRPSWGLGSKPGAEKKARPAGRDANGRRFADPLHIFARYARAQGRSPAAERPKPMHESDKRALETLGIHGAPKTEEIKKAYKKLVKIHHPDANGGDKGSEERLRSIIAAYTHLKSKGFLAS